MIGINNCDIGKFEFDDGNVSLMEKLVLFILKRYVKVSESGIVGMEDLKRVLRYVDVVLIGIVFMKILDFEEFFRKFVEVEV